MIVRSSADEDRSATDSDEGHGTRVFSMPRALKKADVSWVAKSLKPALARVCAA